MKLQKLTRSAMAAVAAGMLFQWNFIGSCDDRMATLTRYFDPCGTILANCQPGDFQLNRADVADYCVDPSCTVPGQCQDQNGLAVPPLGLNTDLCP